MIRPRLAGFEVIGDTVRIEVSAEQSLLLPFDQFAFAELRAEGKQQLLRVVFATHQVLVRDHSLRRIETAMQRAELPLLTAALSDKQRSLISDGQPVVNEIVVTQGKEDEVATEPLA